MKRYIELNHTEVVQALNDYVVKHFNLQPTGYPILVEPEVHKLDMPADVVGAIRIEVKS